MGRNGTPVTALPTGQVAVRTAVVTGADSGIGRSIAAALAGGGVDVGITYATDREGAENTAREVAPARGSTARSGSTT